MVDKFKTKGRVQMDEDALYDLLYHILWSKEAMYEESNFLIHLPDTVIFRNGQPYIWYFSNSEGRVLKKKELSLNLENIKKTFLKKKGKYGIVAYYISIPDRLSRALNPTKIDNHEDDTAMPQIEYFSEAEFRNLFQGDNIKKLERGILQRFIDPSGRKNTIIQAVWTKSITILSRRMNYRELKDPNYNFYEKCATFDGPAHLSEPTPLRGMSTSQRIKSLMDLIIRHVSSISFEKQHLSKIISYFKTDEQGRIWYLWSGFVRFSQTLMGGKNKKNEERVDTDELDLEDHLSIPKDIFVSANPQINGKGSLERLIQCQGCGITQSPGSFVNVEYQQIIQNHENAINWNERTSEMETYHQQKLMICPKDATRYRDIAENLRVRSKAAEIPLLIRKLHPRLKVPEYERIKNHAHFAQKQMQICFNCYYRLIGTNEQAGIPTKVQQISDEKLKKLRGYLRSDGMRTKEKVNLIEGIECFRDQLIKKIMIDLMKQNPKKNTYYYKEQKDDLPEIPVTTRPSNDLSYRSGLNNRSKSVTQISARAKIELKPSNSVKNIHSRQEINANKQIDYKRDRGSSRGNRGSVSSRGNQSSQASTTLPYEKLSFRSNSQGHFQSERFSHGYLANVHEDSRDGVDELSKEDLHIPILQSNFNIGNTFGQKMSDHLRKKENIFLSAKNNTIIHSNFVRSPQGEMDRVKDFVNPNASDWDSQRISTERVNTNATRNSNSELFSIFQNNTDKKSSNNGKNNTPSKPKTKKQDQKEKTKPRVQVNQRKYSKGTKDSSISESETINMPVMNKVDYLLSQMERIDSRPQTGILVQRESRETSQDQISRKLDYKDVEPAWNASAAQLADQNLSKNNTILQYSESKEDSKYQGQSESSPIRLKKVEESQSISEEQFEVQKAYNSPKKQQQQHQFKDHSSAFHDISEDIQLKTASQ